MSERDRLTETIGEWLQAREAGKSIDPETLIAAHRELAAELQARGRGQLRTKSHRAFAPMWQRFWAWDEVTE